MNFTALKEKYLKDPAVKAEYDALEPEYQLIRAMLSARKRTFLSKSWQISPASTARIFQSWKTEMRTRLSKR